VYTASIACKELSLQWLNQCTQGHEACRPENRKHSAPSRLIKIGTYENGNDLKLVETNRAFWTGMYAALSYCWGGHATLRLETTNMEGLLASFSSTSLPRTVQDAIRVVRMLGIRYLWIDSLCIVQDSVSDWEQEAERMGDVYRNCYLNVAALGAPSSEKGLFAERLPLAYQPCRMFQDVHGQHVYIYPHKTEEELVTRCFDHAALSTRGWAMQERLLSPRTLNFGISLMWECRSCFLSDFSSKDVLTDMDEIPATVTPKALLMAARTRKGSITSIYEQEERNVLDYWNSKILVPYSQTQFTFEKDRLVALRGVIQEFSKHTKWQNIGGLWKPFLIEQNLWSVVRTSEDKELKPRIPGVPTWSWASVESAIEFPHNSFGGSPTFEAKAKEIRLHTWSTEIEHGDPGVARIMIESSLLMIEELDYTQSSSRYVRIPQSPGLKLADFEPDTASIGSGPFYFLPLLEIGETFGVFPHAFGIAVSRSDSSSYYQRVGFVSLDLGPKPICSLGELTEDKVNVIII
jgi:hypothetical protein